MTSDGPMGVDGPDVRRLATEVHVVEATEATMTVLDHQVHFERTGASRKLQLRADQIRRVQIDFEVGRPATVVIVPHSPMLEAQMLTVHPEQFAGLFPALHHLAQDLDDVSGRTPPD